MSRITRLRRLSASFIAICALALLLSTAYIAFLTGPGSTFSRPTSNGIIDDGRLVTIQPVVLNSMAIQTAEGSQQLLVSFSLNPTIIIIVTSITSLIAVTLTPLTVSRRKMRFTGAGPPGPPAVSVSNLVSRAGRSIRNALTCLHNFFWRGSTYAICTLPRWLLSGFKVSVVA